MLVYLDKDFKPTDRQHATFGEFVSGKGVSIFVLIHKSQVQKALNNNPEFNQKHPRGQAGKFTFKPNKKVTNTFLAASHKARIDSIMQELGAGDKYRISTRSYFMNVEDEQGNPVKFPAMAAYNPKRDEIILYPAALKNIDVVKPAIVHELGHRRYVKISTKIGKLLSGEIQPSTTPESIMVESLTKIFNKVPKPPTEYSKMYWDSFHKVQNAQFFVMALNETFAEMNRLYHTDKMAFSKAHTVWKGFYYAGSSPWF